MCLLFASHHLIINVHWVYIFFSLSLCFPNPFRLPAVGLHRRWWRAKTACRSTCEERNISSGPKRHRRRLWRRLMAMQRTKAPNPGRCWFPCGIWQTTWMARSLPATTRNCNGWKAKRWRPSPRGSKFSSTTGTGQMRTFWFIMGKIYFSREF